ncbi:B-box zinc finger protein 20 [Humulus lupulus]|uniref:B-box zinc finger protein 20 n=1 Tax=Humulus lupulus TaxID=3486 RepID=UPI002B40F4DB|nr:B-box zinc finger protein 20 [Humulus lupulus]
MKIRCDVCDKEEASVFCTADEAALCDDCDRRVHHANKLASKHSRFSLLQPGFKESPLCDICLERRAFLFCQEDRAILCRECDIPIHRANEHTKKHNRFLLTGAKLSPSSSTLYQNPSTSSSTATSSEAAINTSSVTPIFSTTTTKRLITVVSNNNEITSSSSIDNMTPFPYNSTTNNESGSYLTSSISEYLMETLPGWHVEDFLDPSSSSASNNNNNGFCKTNNNDGEYEMSRDDDFDSNKCFLNSSQDQDQVGLYDWVPQISPPSKISKNTNTTNSYHSNNGVFYAEKTDEMMMKKMKLNYFNFNPKWGDDDNGCCIMIPPSSSSLKTF